MINVNRNGGERMFKALKVLTIETEGKVEKLTIFEMKMSLNYIFC